MRGAGDKRENSVLSSQCCCEFKSALKIKVIKNKHVYRYMWCSCLCVCSVCVGTAVERVRVKLVKRPVDANIFFSVPRAGTALPLPLQGQFQASFTQHIPLAVVALIA